MNNRSAGRSRPGAGGTRFGAAAALPALLLAAGWLVVVLAVTLTPVPSPGADAAGSSVLSIQQWTDTGRWRSGSMTEFLANVLLFAPLGALLASGLPRAPGAALAGFAAATSLLIEVMQIGSARISDPRDLLANSLGAAIAIVMQRAVRPARP